jgi:hypothetical protein
MDDIQDVLKLSYINGLTMEQKDIT